MALRFGWILVFIFLAAAITAGDTITMVIVSVELEVVPWHIPAVAVMQVAVADTVAGEDGEPQNSQQKLN